MERLAISSVRPDVGCKPPFSIAPSAVGDYNDGYLWPQHAFMVKGWSRSLSGLTVMLAMYQSPEFLKARSLRHSLFEPWGELESCRLCQRQCWGTGESVLVVVKT